MGREKKQELYVKVPSLFRCPISMDVMKSPVSLCTGVTYDRSSIQKWLSQGHNTCPATMQVLPSTDFIPNLTLRRLINHWSDHPHSPNSRYPSVSMPLSKQQITDFIRGITTTENRSSSLSKLLDFAKFSDENRKFLADSSGILPALVELLKNINEVEACELIFTVLDFILSENGVKEELKRLIRLKSNRDSLSPFVLVLQKGSSNSKIHSARILEAIATDAESQHAVTEKHGLLYDLYRLLTSETNHSVAEAGLSAIITVATSRASKKELVRFGIVRTIGNILSGADTVRPVIEKAMKVLETVATIEEGRAAICEDKQCVPAVIQKLMKVSSAATEHGVTVLWSVCHLARDRTAQETVTRSNGLIKLLLVMQSSCSGSARLMCADLVKVLRIGNSKQCLASYDTKTTHIMPF